MGVRTGQFFVSSTSREKSECYSVFKNPRASAMKWKKELAKAHVDGIMRIVSQYTAGRWYASGQ